MASLSNNELFELLKEKRLRDCRRCFYTYRQTMNPKDKWGWFQAEIAAELQQFYEDLVAGRRPKLVIQAPPQHGKSVQIIDFISWLAGKNPDIRTIYTSFSERLGIRANLKLQRTYDSVKYQEIFPGTTINKSNSVAVSGQYLRNREILEYVERTGFFRNTTVRGSITGESLDLGVIDDPIRGRQDANSATVRDAAWDWFTDDFFTRFSEEAGLLAILTRWHVDDPIGRLIDRYPDVKVLSYPAIATHDEQHRKAGEALFPEHKSLEFLLERRAVMDSANWQALYQQSPTIQGGELFHDDWWQFYDDTFTHPEYEYRRIYADTALKTGEANDYSVFQCWGYKSGHAYLLDQIRGKWEAPELIRQAKAFWAKHQDPTNRGLLQSMKIEDKASGTGLIQTLKAEGVPVIGIPRSTDKFTRAQNVLAQIEAGLVHLPRHLAFTKDLLGELAMFPNGVNDDQVDPLIDAIADNLVTGYNLSAW